MRVWDLETGSLLHTLTGHHRRSIHRTNTERRAKTGGVRKVTTGELNGQPIAVTGGDDGTARVWDLTEGRLRHTLAGHRTDIYGIAIGQLHGKPVAITGCDDRELRVWDLEDGALRYSVRIPLRLAHNMTAGEMDGQPIVITAGQDDTARIWDLGCVKEPRTEVLPGVR